MVCYPKETALEGEVGLLEKVGRKGQSLMEPSCWKTDKAYSTMTPTFPSAVSHPICMIYLISVCRKASTVHTCCLLFVRAPFFIPCGSLVLGTPPGLIYYGGLLVTHNSKMSSKV